MNKTFKHLAEHPVFVTSLVATFLVTVASFLLCYVEPMTFPNFWDGAWFSVTTITTIGYGDIVPYSAAGRIISVVLILSGISLAGVLIGLISEMVRERLLKTKHISMLDLSEALAENKKLLSELLAERQEQNELLRQLLQTRPGKPPQPPEKS